MFAGRPAEGAVPSAVKNHLAPFQVGLLLRNTPAVQSPVGLVHPSAVLNNSTHPSRRSHLGCAASVPAIPTQKAPTATMTNETISFCSVRIMPLLSP